MLLKHKYLCILFSFLPLSLQSQSVHESETGIPFIQNFLPKEYGAANQNWAIAQSRRGLMYFGNTEGIIEYDGHSWRKIRTRNHSAVRSIAIDSTDRIYIGAMGEFGFLGADSAGSLQFVSLTPFLDKFFSDFGNVWQTYILPDGVYFGTNKYVFRWDGYKIDVFRAANTFHRSFVVSGKFYIRENNVGLLEMKNDSLVLAPQGEKFAHEPIYVMLPFDYKRILVGTRNQGLFLYNGDTFEIFPTEAGGLLKENQIYHGVVLPDGNFLLTSLRGGIVVMDSLGHMVERLDKSSGIQDDAAYYSFLDHQNGVWLALDNGISRIEMPSPFSKYDKDHGLKGAVQGLLRHKGQLYAATFQGIFRLESAKTRSVKRNFSKKEFIPIPGISTQCWCLLSAGSVVLAGTSDGIYSIDGSQIRLIRKEGGGFCMIRSATDTNVVYAGLRNGVAELRLKNGLWMDNGTLDGIREEIRTMVQISDGSIWLGTRFQGAIRLLPANTQKWTIKAYDQKDGLPAGGVFVFNIHQKIAFGTQKGLFLFQEVGGHFSPDSTFGKIFTDTTLSISLMAQDRQGNTWIQLELPDKAELVMAQRLSDNSYRLVLSPFQRFSDFYLYTIFPDTDSITWLGGPDGLIRFDEKIAKDDRQHYSPLIRRVIITGDSVIFYGAGGNYAHRPYWNYAHNDVRFEVAMASYDQSTRNQFQFLLDGFDPSWTSWNMESKKDYTNLPEGHYRFHVQGKNIYSQIGAEDVYDFNIEPPWYRTWWAWGFYAWLLSTVVYGVSKWRAVVLETEKKQLEQIVETRTKELTRQTEKLERKSNELETINSIVKSINSEIRLPELLHAVLNETRAIKGMEKASVLVRDPEENVFHFQACSGWDFDLLKSIRLSLDESDERYIKHSEEIFEDIFIVKRIAGRRSEEKVLHLGLPQSMLIMRIRVKDRIEGFLIFDNMHFENAFDDQDIALLKNLKEHIASAFIKTKLLDELRWLNESKNEFLGVAAHDLRNPLNAIVGYSGMIIEDMKDHRFDMSQGMQDMEDIMEAAKRMTHLISELLDISAIESGKVNLDLQKEDLNAILDDCEKLNARSASQKKIRLTIEKNHTLPELHVDKSRIAEVLDNLLSNAIKYTFPGGEVKVFCEMRETEVITNIQDTGQGLSDEDLQHVFRSFRKLSAKPTAGETSTGLGLAIVKKIVEMHGGRVWVESSKEHGSTFSFSLPF